MVLLYRGGGWRVTGGGRLGPLLIRLPAFVVQKAKQSAFRPPRGALLNSRKRGEGRSSNAGDLYEAFLIDVTMPVLSSTVTATLAPTFSLPTAASGDNW